MKLGAILIVQVYRICQEAVQIFIPNDYTCGSVVL